MSTRTSCADEISESRLKALPFAGRCVHCEQAREADVVHERMRERKLLRLAGLTVALTMMSLTVFAQSAPPVADAAIHEIDIVTRTYCFKTGFCLCQSVDCSNA